MELLIVLWIFWNTTKCGDIRLMRRWDSADNNSVNFVDGDLAIVKIYDDHLTTLQIQQNFNDNKARFGL
jgi:hypothetical protein